jgi:hypothetical protein
MSHEPSLVSAIPKTGSVRRALLRTHGFIVTDEILPARRCTTLAEEVREAVAKGPVISCADGSLRAVALLAYSSVALKALDDESIGLLIDEGFNDNAILSRAEGVVVPSGRETAWQVDFLKPRSSVPSYSFRPGVTVWIPLHAAGGRIDVIRSSQNSSPAISPAGGGLVQVRLDLSAGCAALLEGGVRYRLAPSPATWLCLSFVREWMKPEVLYSSALSAERLSRLGQRGRQWCAMNIGLPTSVEEFLSIEAAALDSAYGRAKGSGI